MLSLIFGIILSSITQFIQVPLDHEDPQSRKITISFQFESDFENGKETIFYLEDPIDRKFQVLSLSKLAKDDFNWVKINGRYFSEDFEKLIRENAIKDWAKVYRWLNQNQVAKDIELIRRKVLGENKVNLVSYSSSTGIFLHYLSLHSEKVNKLICINPLLFDIQGNLSFWSLSNYFGKLQTGLTDEEFFEFAYQSNTDFFNSKSEVRDSLIVHSLNEFKTKKIGSESEVVDFNIALAVRSFEHSIGMGIVDGKSDPIFNYLRSKSEELWKAHSAERFPLFGINYDSGLSFKGQVTIFGSAYNLLIYPKVVDVLAEFFPDTTLIVFRDGHSLQLLNDSKEFSSLMSAFLKNDFNQKVEAYQKLTEINLIFIGKGYNRFRIN